METLFNNKRFIQASTALVFFLSLFVIMLFINATRETRFIGRGNMPLNTIVVSGKGEVTAVSDIANITVNLTKDAGASKAAQDSLNVLVTKTLDYLKSKDIADADIKSQYGGLTPRYSSTTIECFAYPCPQPAPKITGYTATQSISIKIRVVDSANEIRTGLAGLGITDISGPSFAIDNQDELNDQARALAIKDAQAKAQTLAKQLGVSLGSVANFSENGGGYYPVAMQSAAGNYKDAAAVPELPKGENTINSNVMITYEIK